MDPQAYQEVIETIDNVTLFLHDAISSIINNRTEQSITRKKRHAGCEEPVPVSVLLLVVTVHLVLLFKVFSSRVFMKNLLERDFPDWLMRLKE